MDKTSWAVSLFLSLLSLSLSASLIPTNQPSILGIKERESSFYSESQVLSLNFNTDAAFLSSFLRFSTITKRSCLRTNWLLISSIISISILRISRLSNKSGQILHSLVIALPLVTAFPRSLIHLFITVYRENMTRLFAHAVCGFQCKWQMVLINKTIFGFVPPYFEKIWPGPIDRIYCKNSKHYISITYNNANDNESTCSQSKS